MGRGKIASRRAATAKVLDTVEKPQAPLIMHDTRQGPRLPNILNLPPFQSPLALPVHCKYFLHFLHLLQLQQQV